MKSEQVEVKTKRGGEQVVLGVMDYSYPDSLEEAIEVDGEEKIYKIYCQKRKSNAMDDYRRMKTGKGLPKEVTSALKDADPEKLAQICALLGVELPQV